MIQIRINLDTRSAKRNINRIQRQINNRRALFKIIRNGFIVQRINRIFGTNGFGTWRPTQRPNPTLRDTYDLYRSYTIAGAKGNINRTSGGKNFSRLVWGSSLSYAERVEREFPVIGLLADREGSGRLSNIVQLWVRSIVRRA